MITNQEIVDTYLAYRHMKLSDALHREDVRMLVPFYLMDASYQLYCRDIKSFNCSHKIRQAKTRWNESYRKFFADFFMAFNPDQQEFITDQMDEFEDYIHNKVVMLKSTVMKVFRPEASFDEKKILASVLTCNALAQMAQFVHRDMFRGEMLQPKNDPHVDAVIKSSYDFAKNFPVTKGVDLTSSKEVSAMINTLCKEVLRFLNLKLNGREN